MSTVVDTRVSAAEFALARSLREHPGARFEIGRAIANTSAAVMPFLWTSGGDLDAIGASLAADPTTESVEAMGRFDDAALFEVEWTPRVHNLFDALLADDGATLLDARATGGEWCLRLTYPEAACVESVDDECAELGLDLDVERAYSLSEAFTRDHFQLTEKQYETILAAYEAGYYDVPRRINLQQLAEELDVSHQALSERLRRGHEVLMANSLGVGFEEADLTDVGSDARVTAPPLVRADRG